MLYHHIHCYQIYTSLIFSLAQCDTQNVLFNYNFASFRNGDRYEGEWVQNKKQGQGMCRTADGTIYDVRARILVFMTTSI